MNQIRKATVATRCAEYMRRIAAAGPLHRQSHTRASLSTTLRVRTAGLIATVATATLACGGPPYSNAPGQAPVTPAHEGARPTELARVVERLMAPPQLHAEEGFSARV